MQGLPLHPAPPADPYVPTDDLAHRTVADLVAEDYRRAEVFKKNGIDFCCGGGRSVEAVCRKKGLDYDVIAQALEDVTREKDASQLTDAKSWDLSFLADYIVNIHHRYVRENIPLLSEFTAKVARVHGHANPEVIEIADRFAKVASEMTQHMMKEEGILFPYIKRLERTNRSGQSSQTPPFGTVKNPIRMMEHEHDQVGTLMHEIHALSSDYTPPEHACNTYRVAYFKLNEFEQDLHTHIHLENNILFPRAVALEGEEPSTA